jgi:hypothetical protein
LAYYYYSYCAALVHFLSSVRRKWSSVVRRTLWRECLAGMFVAAFWATLTAGGEGVTLTILHRLNPFPSCPTPVIVWSAFGESLR